MHNLKNPKQTQETAYRSAGRRTESALIGIGSAGNTSVRDNAVAQTGNSAWASDGRLWCGKLARCGCVCPKHLPYSLACLRRSDAVNVVQAALLRRSQSVGKSGAQVAHHLFGGCEIISKHFTHRATAIV